MPIESSVRNVNEQPQQQNNPESPTTSATRPEINFDGLRSAITPINLMYDGKLFKDLKVLISHVTYAMKKVAAVRPDYQGALSEIDQLEATFRTVFIQWENKLNGEIQRLKNAVETAPNKSLGATKQIHKFQAELNRGKASTRSMPTKTSQVRNQLIAASGELSTAPIGAATSAETETRPMLRKEKAFPVIYKNCIKQILRRARKLNDEKRFCELALAIFKDISKPTRALEDTQLQHGVLYYLHQTAAGDDVTDELIRQKAQFMVVNDLNETGDVYLFRSAFPEINQTYAIPVADLTGRKIDIFEPLKDMDVILKLLAAKFKESDFATTFNLYHLLRKKALEAGRDEKFNQKQLAIHEYLTGQIFEFVGIVYDDIAAEIRYVGEINSTLQRIA